MNVAFRAGLMGLCLAGWYPAGAWGATWFVAASGDDTAGTNWATAKQTIQAAVDLTSPGDTVLVTNGVYATGGKVITGSMTNRVAITNAITVTSVNGPDVTVIRGAADGGLSNGNAAVRGVYMTNGAALIGFTVTNGFTRTAGDFFLERAGGGIYGETNTVVSNCYVTGCSADTRAAGVYRGQLYNCRLVGNVAVQTAGGGSAESILYNCFITGNRCPTGAGAYLGTLYNCTVIDNTAPSGGGVANCSVINSIVYYNTPSNYLSSTINFSCIFPFPVAGLGNVSNAPNLTSLSHLGTNSPCRAAGNSTNSFGTDIDGETWVIPPSMGCDELNLGAITGGLSVAATAVPLLSAVGQPVAFRAMIDGRTTESRWDFGDGTSITNHPLPAHTFGVTGMYPVSLRAYNETFPAGVEAVVTVVVASADYFVATNGAHISPFDTWATAATNIQAAVDVAPSGSVVWVSNGLYNTGGRVVFGAMTNRLVVTNAVTVRSVNGPDVTFIAGAPDPATNGLGNAAIRCVLLGPTASLDGFTLTNGHTRAAGDITHELSGGGVWCATNSIVTNCVVAGNRCTGNGGGGYLGRYYNCRILQNVAGNRGGGLYIPQLAFHCIVARNRSLPGEGGGSYQGFLAGCALYGNTATRGGGGYSATIYSSTLAGNTATESGGGGHSLFTSNCIIYYNVAPSGTDHFASSLRRTCARDATNAFGNITNEPVLASATHLATNSPCTGAGGTSSFVAVDLDGESWLNPVSMGCDEFIGGAVTGPLSVTAFASSTNTLTISNILFVGATFGRTTRSTWDFGDGTVITNFGVANYTYPSAGTFTVQYVAFNDSNPGGVSTSLVVQIIGASLFVATNGAHVSPFDSWTNAATNIQAAVDLCPPGGTVFVSNGVYNSGGRVAGGGALTNRLVITNLVTVRSMNGPDVTSILGASDPATTSGLGAAAIRCVYIGTNATLAGFTIASGRTSTNGAALDLAGGGVGVVVSFPPIGIISNCVLTGNRSQSFGGGAYYGTFRNSRIAGNQSGSDGGGVYNGVLTHCLVNGNVATGANGGGVAGSLAAASCSALYGNRASGGGGTYQVNVNNCIISGNTALENGGMSGGSALNSIIYWNRATAGSNQNHSASLNWSCSVPTNGTTSITNDPLLASFSHLSTNSPCLGTGTSGFLTVSVDIDNETILLPPPMGCDQVVAGAITGPLTVTSTASTVSILAGQAIDLSALITGRVSSSVWTLGDGTVISNQPFLTHTFASSGTYAVVLRAVNDSFPGGIASTILVTVAANDYFVSLTGSNTPPYDAWAIAATSIQTAIDFVPPTATIWVSNGVYNTGGKGIAGQTTNRVSIDKAVTVRSVNGPGATFIVGKADPAHPSGNSNAAIRCVYITNGATLIGFTLTNGHTRTEIAGSSDAGGGVWGELSAVVSNCVMTGNSAEGNGGGAFRGRFFNCLFIGNNALQGGGAYFAELNSCTVRLNRAFSGGGTSFGFLQNCLVYTNVASSFIGNGGGCLGGTQVNCTIVGNVCSNNTAGGGGGVSFSTVRNSIVLSNLCVVVTSANHESSSFTNSCTSPGQTGSGNITNDPLFANWGAGNFRLTARSPCVNGGSNALVSAAGDLDGNPRVVAGLVDMGAYEFQAPPFTGTWFVAGSGSDTNVGTSWDTAKLTPQAAADLSLSGETILVSNGTYATGGRVVVGSMTNRVALTNAVTLRSVNGPDATVIVGAAHPGTTNGNAAVRGLYAGSNVVVSGFTFSNGHTRTTGASSQEQSGGGAWCASNALLSNCIFRGNSANQSGGGVFDGLLVHSIVENNGAVLGGGVADVTADHCAVRSNSASLGGGAYNSLVYNSLLVNNASTNLGGGTYLGLLVNSTVASNSAAVAGGGSVIGMAFNSIVYHNTSVTDANYSGTAFTNSCTTPLPAGSGNFTSPPAFLHAGAGNFRLGGLSPCIDSGSNALAIGSVDLDGNPRMVNGRVDVGAYEFMGYWGWALAITNGLTNYTDNAAGDGYPNLLKYAAGASPTVSSDVARLGFAFSNTAFGLRFPRDTNALDVTIIVEGSYEMTNGAPWVGVATNINGSWGGATNFFETGGSNPVVVTVTDTLPGTNRFLRERVSRP